MTIRTKGEQRAYLDGYEMCGECIEKYLSDDEKQRLKVLLTAVRNAVDTEDLPDSAEGEYINKEDATKALSDHFMYLQRLKHDEGNGCKKYEQAGINWCLNTLNELSTYSFPEREKGEWIEHEPFEKRNCNICIECSVCHTWFGHDCYAKTNFCPNCGADMRGE